ncbi:hypothetical protein [Psychromonas sp.]|uniref:hypothetical protein n=1 Tax=Psychromonas sp. TaxID=1884585 RepID=UPI003566B5D8
MLLIFIFFFVESINAAQPCFSISCTSKGIEKIQREGKNAREAAQREAKNTREAAQREAKNTREAVQREAKNAREAVQREAKNAREAVQREAKNAREAAQRAAIIRRENTLINIEKEASRRTKQFNNINTGIVNKSRSEINSINNSASENIGYIQEKSQQEIQRITEDIEHTTQQLYQYVNENPIDKEGLESALEAAQEVQKSNIGKSTRSFGVQVNKTIDGIESSEVGEILDDVGKKVSTEKTLKGVTNTIDYWESSEVGEAIDKASESVNDYIDVRTTTIDKKVKAGMEVNSPNEWVRDKVFGVKARRHHNVTLLRQYGEEHKCERNIMYKRLGYSAQQAAILNYFLYGNDCENIRDTKTVDAFISFFGSEFSQNLKISIESGRWLDEQALERLFLSTFDNTYREFNFIQGASKTSFMLSSTERNENFPRSKPIDLTENAILSNNGLNMDFIEGASISSTGSKPSPKNEPSSRMKSDVPEQTQHFEQAASSPPPTLREEWQKKEFKDLQKNTSSFKSQFQKKFIKPLIQDARTIISMHKKTINLSTDIALKLGTDEVKGKIKELVVSVFDNVITKGVTGALLINKAINTTFTSYQKENLKYVKKNDPTAKPVPEYFGSGGLAAAAKKAQECGCTVWEGIGGFWYFVDKLNYSVSSRSTRVLRGNSQILPGNGRSDNRPETFIKDVLKDSVLTFVTEYFSEKIKNKLKSSFKEQLKG